MLSIMHPSGMQCCCDAQRAARPDGWAAMGLGMRSWVCGWVGLASWNPAAMTRNAQADMTAVMEVSGVRRCRRRPSKACCCRDRDEEQAMVYMVEICGWSGDLIWDATEILKFHCPFFSQ